MSKMFNRYLKFNFKYIPPEMLRSAQYQLTEQIHVDIYENDDPYDSAVFVKNGNPVCIEFMIVNHKSWYTDLILDKEFLAYLETL